LFISKPQEEIVGQELQVPDSFKLNKPAQGFAFLDPTSESLAEGIGQSYGVIGYKGKTWSLRYRGERHILVRPDDGTPSAYLDMIILGSANHKSKSYYKKYDSSVDSEGIRPICASADGVVPDADVAVKQCDNCALCPRNQRKPDPTSGQMVRECSDFKRLAVLMLPNVTKALLGEPLMEPVFLRVPAGSLSSLAVLGETMANQGYHYSSFITRVTFNPEKSWPEMVFRPLQGLTDKEAPIIKELRQDPIVPRIIGAETSQSGPKQIAQQQSVETGLTSTGVSGTASETQPNNSRQSGDAQPATQATPQAKGSTSATTSTSQTQNQRPTESVDTGFGGVTLDLTAEKAQQPQPTTQTFSDTGEPEQSDADLDARIAGLLKTS
jgi:hypothetical protein